MKNSFYILFFLSLATYGQNESFKASSQANQLLIGEPVEITLELSYPASIANENVKIPSFKKGDTLGNGWEIWEVDTVKFSNFENENGEYVSQLIQNIEIANFDTGFKEIPKFKALVNNKSISTNSLPFTINSVKLADDQTIKNIKDLKLDPLTFIEKLMLWLKKYWIYILLPILIVILIIYLYKKFKAKEPLPSNLKEPAIPIADLLLEKLKKIEKKKLWQNGKYKQYFTKVNDVAREFIEHRYKVSTFEKTSNEIIDSLQLSSMENDWLTKLEKLFTISDLVKFAKQIPTENENISAISTVRELIVNERSDVMQKEES